MGRLSSLGSSQALSTTIQKILIANRGEIARRIMRTCRKMGIATVAVYSEADADMPFVEEADEAVLLGPAPSSESYLHIDRILEAAALTHSDAIHPGYGFLAENAGFAEACGNAGVIFIDVPVHNVGWSDVQSALDLDVASGLGGGFFVWEGLGTSVEGEPGLLRFGFNTAGRSEGAYEVDVTIQATDEDVPGETTHYISLTLVVTIGGVDPVPGDFNGDGLVNGADLGLLLGAWGPCRGCPEDLNDDGVVNGADLGLELGFWTG